MKYVFAVLICAFVGMLAVPYWLLARAVPIQAVGANGEPLAACGMPILGALVVGPPLGLIGGAVFGMLVACFLPTSEPTPLNEI